MSPKIAYKYFYGERRSLHIMLPPLERPPNGQDLKSRASLDTVQLFGVEQWSRKQ